MYENYTRQSLPSKKYRELLGTAICVFNSNNSFVIENILREDESYTWDCLIDKESGKLKPIVEKTIENEEILRLLTEIINKRNRIIHSFQITDRESGEQVLCTKTKSIDNDSKQFIITEGYLMQFIKDNEELSSLLYEYRGY